jgi:hypothetical protein
MADAQPTLIESTISREPRKLYKWIHQTNCRGNFFPLCEDPQNKREVMALCVVFSRKEITFEQFLACVMDLDLFDHSDLGPLLENIKLPERVPDLKNSIDAVMSAPGWKSVFEKKSKVEDRDKSPDRGNGEIDH